MSELTKYRFFGTEANIAGTECNRYAQVLEFEAEVGNKLIAEDPSAQMLPDDEFEKADITEEELATGTVPEEKKKHVRLLHNALRVRLLQTPPKAETQTGE